MMTTRNLLVLFCVAVACTQCYATVDSTTYANLVRYVKFSGKAYSSFTCAGYTKVLQINVTSTDTEGYIARDDTNRQIIVVFRGSVSQQNYNTDANGTQIAYTTGGCSPSCKVHGGFYQAWDSASSIVLSTISSQLSSYPGYSIFVTGHSLGGALAALAGPAIKAAGHSVTVYTYGAPRVFSPSGATWADSYLSSSTNVFRGTHTNDSVPAGGASPYQKHYGIEYWQSPDPSSASTTKQCTGQEDPTCNTGTTATSGNPAHTTYFGFQIGAGGCP